MQRGPLAIDYQETWTQHLRFQAEWDRKLSEEEQLLKATRPALVLSDIAWLPIESAARAQAPVVALCNLSWDQILEPHVEPGRTDQMTVLQEIRQAYGKADLMIRLTPGLTMPAFPKIADVGPVAQPATPAPPDLKRLLNIPDRNRIVLIGFGGIALEALPFERMEQMVGYQFLISGPVPQGIRRARSTDSIPLPFNTLLASADIVMTKPGYSTIIQAVARNRPVLYVRRYNFADEASLVQYLHRYGRGVELSADDFHSGRWDAGLERLADIPCPSEEPPPPTGATEAASILAGYF